jgi:double-stranded RNA-specific adenosine deaminase
MAEHTNDKEGGENMKDSPVFEIRPGVTLHMYTSSAPCGNATIKKFATMKREVFDSTLGPDEWPCTSHEMIAPHSLRLGQFALLVKKDATAANDTISAPPATIKTNKKWPIRDSDEWCPPGTSITGFQRGSIHSCSDKICRWNCLGLQGSLLSSLLEQPLYMSTLTVGRKMTECICRRAVCCRAKGFGDVRLCSKPKKTSGDTSEKRSEQVNNEQKVEEPKKLSMYRLNHPSLMGTSVYMNESGMLT